MTFQKKCQFPQITDPLIPRPNNNNAVWPLHSSVHACIRLTSITSPYKRIVFHYFHPSLVILGRPPHRTAMSTGHQFSKSPKSPLVASSSARSSPSPTSSSWLHSVIESRVIVAIKSQINRTIRCCNLHCELYHLRCYHQKSPQLASIKDRHHHQRCHSNHRPRTIMPHRCRTLSGRCFSEDLGEEQQQQGDREGGDLKPFASYILHGRWAMVTIALAMATWTMKMMMMTKLKMKTGDVRDNGNLEDRRRWCWRWQW